MSRQVFLSYTLENYEQVEAYQGVLQGAFPETTFRLLPKTCGGDDNAMDLAPQIDKAIAESGHFVFFLGSRIGLWQMREFYAALARIKTLQGEGKEPRLVLAVLAKDSKTERPGDARGLFFMAESSEIPAALFPLSGNHQKDAEHIDQALSGQTTPPSGPLYRLIRPYRGMFALEMPDVPFLYGREDDIKAVSEAVRNNSTKITVLLGPSGVGKSSLVHCGLFHQLASDDTTKDWLRPTFRPGSNPLREMVQALFYLFANGRKDGISEKVTAWVKDFKNKRQGLSALLTALNKDYNNQNRYVLFIDQGEELFTLSDSGEREVFLSLLCDAVAGQDPDNPPLSVILAFRTDQYMPIQDNPKVHCHTHVLSVGAVPQETIADLLTDPPQKLGCSLHDEARNCLTVGDTFVRNPNHLLPLITWSLDAMWLKLGETNGELRWPSEQKDPAGPMVDCAKEAICRLANNDPQQERRLLRLFSLDLASLPPGASIEQLRAGEERALRRPRCLEDLPDDRKQLAKELVNNDPPILILPEGKNGGEDGDVDIIHESLLTAWEELRSALVEDQAFRLWHEKLQERIRTSKEAVELLSGQRLATALDWCKTHEMEIDQKVSSYIQESEANANAQEEKRRSLEKRASENESRYWAAQSKELRRRDPAAATALALEAIPLRSERPLTIEAINAVYATGNELKERKVFKHPSGVTSAVFSSDGQRILTASEDNTARLWNVETGKILKSFMGHTDFVTSVALSGDGRKILTSSQDKTARLWDEASEKLIQTFKGHTDVVSSVAFSRDEQKIATASWDNTACLWDTISGEIIQTFIGHKGRIWSVAFSRDGKSIITASDDKTIRLWNINSGEEQQQFVGHTDRVFSAVFSKDGEKIITASDDNTAILWDINSGEKILTFKGHTADVFSATLSIDDQKAITASWDKTAQLWDANSGQPLQVLRGHLDAVLSATFSDDGQSIITASCDKTARLWNITSGKTLQTFHGHAQEVMSVIPSNDGNKIITTSNGEATRLWDVASGETRQFIHAQYPGQWIAALSNDEKMWIVSDLSGTVEVVDIKLRKTLKKIREHVSYVNLAAFSHDGQRILTGSADKTAILWDINSNESLQKFIGHNDRVHFVAFSNDEQSIITTSLDNTARLWDVETGKTIQTFSGHTDWVNSAALSSDGKRVVTASKDKTARLWDVETGAVLATFPEDGPVLSTAFTADNRSIRVWVRGGNNGETITLREHFVGRDWRDYAEDLERRLPRKLTPAQRETYHLPPE